MNETERALLELFHDADSLLATQQLFAIFLTDTEWRELMNRLRIFVMLAQGHTQRDIADRLGVGVATVSRGARAYQQYQLEQRLPQLKQLSLDNL
ncbi:trp operon repressor [Suttonella sp. R2A3]|uniref:Trp family transcriptional regulator n=1 Tax=Suttonella sp. R2A3 TaxID=2908648 RepID=UPI001F39BF6B|nr:Trp family transcriptional regulator [Suttonella sp. R2A3]UJF25212.1 trp operon repressor [Suttonella sp. R2A3]